MRRLVLFYALAFGISWTGWAAVLLLGSRANVMLVLVAIGPAAAAAIAVRPESPRILLRWRADARWYLIAVLLPVTLLALAAAVSRWLPAGAADLSASRLAPLFVIQCLIANPLEELGWRGFALPRLEAIFGSRLASLMVGAFWAVWHLPMFIWADSPMAHYPIASWAALLIAESFMLTWLYHKAASSLVVVSLFHITINLAGVLIGVPSFALAASVFAAAAFMLWWKIDNY